MKNLGKIFPELRAECGNVKYVTKCQRNYIMQRSMLKFTSKGSPSHVKAATQHLGLETVSGHIKQEFVMVNFFQDQECIEGA